MGTFADQLKAFHLKTEGLSDRVVRTAILEVFARVVVRSPVDTGRFRSAWTVSADYLVVREPAVAEGTTTGSPIPPPDPPALVERCIGRRFYIVNNISYGPALEDGGSKQAPSGMVGLTALQWPSIVRAAVRAVRG